MDVELGIIEGFYGRPWSWEDRRATVEVLAPFGYRFYIYAPKADPYLRRRWQEPFPAEGADGLARLAERCRELEVRFGVGLTPYELHDSFDDAAREALGRKLGELDAIGVQDLGILFDDMRGDVPGLAEKQVRIVEWIAERTSADRLIVCPSYYTDDPVLDRVFGERPAGYLTDLGAGLDPSIEVFWTGPEVCSREFTTGHLDRVTEDLGRKPFLWDNYPVNDGWRMSQFLHVRAFTGRPARIGSHVAAHAVNPALQPTLSRIPCVTLAESYRLGERYDYGNAFYPAAAEVVGEEMAARLREDVLFLQDVGLDRLAEREVTLRERYGELDHPAAREIIQWLDGEYRITPEVVRTQ